MEENEPWLEHTYQKIGCQVNLKPVYYKSKDSQVNVFLNVTNSGLTACEKGLEFTINDNSFTGKLKKEQVNKEIKFIDEKKFAFKKRVPARHTELVQLDFAKDEDAAIGKEEKVNVELQYLQFSSSAKDDESAMKLSFLQSNG